MAVATTTAASRLGVTSYEDSKAATGKGKEEMGKQDFLTLFTAQLKNQNPLEPVKNEAFVAQLAQFSQLEALTNMQGSLDKFVTAQSAERMLNGASLIGKRVPVADGMSRLAAGGNVSASVDLPNGASGVKVQIRNSNGALVQELIAGAQNPGALDFTWDGKDSTGAAAPAGNYKLTATAVVAGATQNVAVQTLAGIRSVTTDPASGDVKLEVEGGSTVSLSSVKRIVQ